MRTDIYFYLIFSHCSCEMITSRISLVTEYQKLQQANHAGVSVSAASPLQCAIECANMLSCDSMSYNVIEGVCHHNPNFADYNQVGLIGGEDWKFYNLFRDLQEDCLALLKTGSTRSGLYYISVTGTDTTSVWCDMDTDGGGWTVFQRRIDGAVDFFRGWDDYRVGFGEAYHEFWLGNEKLHNVTSSISCEMRVDMEDFENNTAYALYEEFTIGSEADSYRLNLAGFSGNAGDSLERHNSDPFSTKDKGNTYCANLYRGAWWYDYCHVSNLNGLYLPGNTSVYAEGITWYSWMGFYYSLKNTKMMIRRLAMV